MINVSKPFLPSIEDYTKYLNGIWERNWLTNNGPLVNELELRLKQFLDVPHLLFLSNGTIALQIAIKALKIKGEIITTPFSYVATTSSIVWEGCTPKFADINAETLNIDSTKIEPLVNSETSAILATHVFGNPCDVDEIEKIAHKYKLKIIYDGAHCFGTKYKNNSIFTFGDICTASFHATKLFHTIEGGAVITTSPTLTQEMALLRNFGHVTPIEFDGIGINGKNSEFHAAMGLSVLEKISEILVKRKQQWKKYEEMLSNCNLTFIKITRNTSEYNYSYFPIIFQNEKQLLKTLTSLNSHYIYPRRYFYPPLNKVNYVANTSCPIAEDIAGRILCLPLYHQLSEIEQEMISRIIIRNQKY